MDTLSSSTPGGPATGFSDASARILIVGGPGSGKSTLAIRLAEILGLPVFHFDHIHWKPGWTQRDDDAKRIMVSDIVARPAWIFEGNHRPTLEMRLTRATALIFLDLPRGLRVRRLVGRVARHYGRTRPDMAANCPERLSLEFLRYAWNWDRRSRPGYVRATEWVRNEMTVAVLRSPAEVDALVMRARGDPIQSLRYFTMNDATSSVRKSASAERSLSRGQSQ